MVGHYLSNYDQLILLFQITFIPDTNFEEELIDLGIDSDGMINGQVLTSDVEIVTMLNISNSGINDLTGIEDFAALEYIDLSDLFVPDLDLSNNLQLREIFIASSLGAPFDWNTMDLSQNLNLTDIRIDNLVTNGVINLKNDNNEQLTVVFPCKADMGVACNAIVNCIIVDDEEAATNNEPPYNTWFVEADFVYSEDCILNTISTETKQFSLFPNPATDVITLRTANSIATQVQISIYSMQGQLIHSQNTFMDRNTTLDVSA